MDLDQFINNDNYNTYSTMELITPYIVNLTLDQQAQFMYNHVQSCMMLWMSTLHVVIYIICSDGCTHEKVKELSESQDGQTGF